MDRKEITVDMVEAVEKFKSELEEVNEKRENVLEQAEEAKSSRGKDLSDLESKWDELEARRVTLNRKIDRFEDVIDELSSTTFTIRELSYGQVQAVEDIVSQESFNVDVKKKSLDGTPLQGVYRSEFLERSVVDMPEDIDDIMDLPDVVGEWVWERVNAFNTSGDEDMGNMSLEEAME